jgi:flagellar hook-associated protein 3 FlgL
MRISTASMHERAISAILQRQAELARTQNQVATGRRVQSPADDPIAAVHIQELERAIAESKQFASNAVSAANRLSLEEQALVGVGEILQRVRELAVQANSGAVDLASRRMIATELESRVTELVDMANRRDGNGDYLFAGYSAGTQPFVRGSGGVVYYGDDGVRHQQIGPAQRIADGHSGVDVFVAIPEGNGTFVTSIDAPNTGSGSIDVGSVVNRSAWVPDDYTLRFVTATSWEVVNGAATVVASGAYVSGAPIEWNGVRVSVTGAPAAGDTFSIDASGKQDLFTTLDRLVATVRRDVTFPADRARFTTEIAGALQQIDQSIDHVLGVRAEVGSRLSALDSAAQAREDLDIELQSTLSELRDLDYAEAISRLNQQLVGLQAAQETYTRIAGLSLFDYL